MSVQIDDAVMNPGSGMTAHGTFTQRSNVPRQDVKVFRIRLDGQDPGARVFQPQENAGKPYIRTQIDDAGCLGGQRQMIKFSGDEDLMESRYVAGSGPQGYGIFVTWERHLHCS